MKPYTTYWIKHFKQNPEFGHLRFKKLYKGFSGYPPFEIEESLIDEVDIDTFIRLEETRIPLFIGTQMGIYPQLYKIPNFLTEDKIIAILGKSLMSGHVAGLRIYQIKAGSHEHERKELIFFNNEE